MIINIAFHLQVVLSDGRVFVWGKFQSMVPRVSPLMGHDYGVYSDQLLPRQLSFQHKAVSCVSSTHQTVLKTSGRKAYITYERSACVCPLKLYTFNIC